MGKMQRFSVLSRLYPIFWIAFLVVIHLTMGLRPEHWAVVALLLVCYFAHEKSRRFALVFFPFQLFAIVYDFLRLIPKEWVGPVHIQDLYTMEVTLFQWLGFGPHFLPTDFFHTHNHIIIDVITGIAYAVHVVVPLGFGLYLWIRKSPLITVYTWGFFILNMMAFAGYVFYPAAPPWYVTDHGFVGPGWDVVGSAAGLLRVDALLGLPYFAETYAHASWVFGAVPSMHAGFPIFASLFARRVLGKGRWFFYGFAVLVNFSAVYLEHHYVIDLIAGWILAALCFVLMMGIYRTAVSDQL